MCCAPGLLSRCLHRIWIAVCLGPFIVLLMHGAASAGSNRETPRRATPDWYYGDQKGCYWARGRQYCSRYCYWEANGRRYCHDREALAFPTGDPYVQPHLPEPPIYIRPPYARP